MGLQKWYDSKAKKLTMWDIAMLKTAVLVLGIGIGAYIPEMVKQNIWYFAAVFVVLYAVLLYKVFSK